MSQRSLIVLNPWGAILGFHAEVEIFHGLYIPHIQSIIFACINIDELAMRHDCSSIVSNFSDGLAFLPNTPPKKSKYLSIVLCIVNFNLRSPYHPFPMHMIPKRKRKTETMR